jgi:hypothetical protein
MKVFTVLDSKVQYTVFQGPDLTLRVFMKHMRLACRALATSDRQPLIQVNVPCPTSSQANFVQCPRRFCLWNGSSGVDAPRLRGGASGPQRRPGEDPADEPRNVQARSDSWSI